MFCFVGGTNLFDVFFHCVDVGTLNAFVTCIVYAIAVFIKLIVVTAKDVDGTVSMQRHKTYRTHYRVGMGSRYTRTRTRTRFIK